LCQLKPEWAAARIGAMVKERKEMLDALNANAVQIVDLMMAAEQAEALHEALAAMTVRAEQAEADTETPNE